MCTNNFSLPKNRTAFTLIELLTVIGIIAILAAILFPVFARARENARRASCQSNLKQIGLGIMMYTQDYDERLPGAWVGSDGNGKIGGWAYYTGYVLHGDNGTFDMSKGAIYPYIKSEQIFVCPSDSQGAKQGDSYSLNGCALNASVAGFASGRPDAFFDNLSQFMLMAEEDTQHDTTDDGYQLIQNNWFSDRHLEGSNVVFVDGHVKWFKKTLIVPSKIQTGGVSKTACP